MAHWKKKTPWIFRNGKGNCLRGNCSSGLSFERTEQNQGTFGNIISKKEDVIVISEEVHNQLLWSLIR